MLRLLFVLLALSVSASSSAQTLDTWRWTGNTSCQPTGSLNCYGGSPDASLTAFVAAWAATHSDQVSCNLVIDSHGAFTGDGTASGGQNIGYHFSNPLTTGCSSSAGSPNSLAGIAAISCSTGKHFSAASAGCVADAASCTAGQQGGVLVPIGYDTTPNPASGSPVAVIVPISPSLNIGGCKALIDGSIAPDGSVKPANSGNVPGYCQTSANPGTTGYYQTSCYMRYHLDGSQGTGITTMEDNFNQQPPACQGTTGSVNGKTVCLPTAGTSQPSTPPAPKTTQTASGPVTAPPTSATDVHTPDSGGGGRSGTSYPTGSNQTGTGTPAPAEQRGINAGAPGAVATGSTPPGNAINNTVNNAGGATGGGGANVDLSVEVCGLPGKAPCKIDESGTPSSLGSTFSQANSDLNSAAASRQQGIQDVGGSGKVTSLGWLFSVSLPSAACQSFEWTFHGETVTYDWCPLLARARQLWGWVLGLLTALYVWRMLILNVGGGTK